MVDVDHGPLPSLDCRGAGACRARARSPARRAAASTRGGCGRATRRRRRSASGLTAYRRRVPCGRTVAKPLSRRTLSCCETAGWEIPNSSWMTAQTAPEGRSPSARSSRILRRTGSPSTLNACTSRRISGQRYISDALCARARALAQRGELRPRARVRDVLGGRATRGARSRRPSARARRRSAPWASESMRISTPACAAARAWTSLRSRRSGAELISSIVPRPRRGLDDRVDVERVRLARARSCGPSGGRSRRSTGARSRRPCAWSSPAAGIPNDVCTEPTTQSSWASRSSS